MKRVEAKNADGPKKRATTGDLVTVRYGLRRVVLFTNVFGVMPSREASALGRTGLGLVVGTHAPGDEDAMEALVLTDDSYGWCYIGDLCVVESSFL